MALIKIIGALVLVGVIGNAVVGHGSNKSSGNSTPQTVKVRLDRSGSWCAADPGQARIRFQLRLENKSARRAKVSVLPVRRYNDGSTNDSVMDLLDVTVPAYATKSYYAVFDYNALNHDLLECSVRIDRGAGLGSAAPIRVG